MKPDADIEPLADLAEQRFNELLHEAQAAVNRLQKFWTDLYGPSEALHDTQEELLGLYATFYEDA